jgi:hypothetical protein
MELVVLPRKRANPAHRRLDGNSSGGNRQIAGMFRHQGKIWKVHADTHYEPLLLAYDFVVEKKIDDPFLENNTRIGLGACLVLQDSIQSLLSKPRFKYLYVYEV